MSLTGKIFDIKKYAINDGPGIRTTVFFMGCPLDCRWCHNPECRLTDLKNSAGLTVAIDTVMDEILKDRLFYDESGGGATFSGGEPMMQVEFLKELLDRCRFEEIHTTVDTCGYAHSDSFEKIMNRVDLFLFDLKIIDNTRHFEFTGVENQLIHDNLKLITDAGRNVSIRIPLIPGVTDTEENLGQIAEFLKGLKNVGEVCLLPYNKLGEDKSERFAMENTVFHGETQDDAKIEACRDLIGTHGFEVTVGG